MSLILSFLMFKFYTPSVGYPLGINIAFVAFIFIIIGYAIKKYVLPFLESEGVAINVIFMMISFAILFLSTFSQGSVGYMKMASADYGNFWIFIITGVFGTFLIAKLSKIICFQNGIKKVLSLLGTNSMMIMILQRDFANYYHELLPVKNNVLICFVSAVIGTAIMLGISLIISRCFPFLCGKYNVSAQ